MNAKTYKSLVAARKPRNDIGIPRAKKGTAGKCEVCLREVYAYPCRPRRFCSQNCRDISKVMEHHDIPNQWKRCGKCTKWKAFDLFVKQKGSPFGLSSYCKECSSQWFHEVRETPDDKRRPYKPKPETPLTREQKRCMANVRAKEYRKKNKQMIIQNNRLYLHRKRAAGVMPDRWEIMRMVCQQDGRCIYCKELLPERYHIDHKTPVIRGGRNDQENLQLLCGSCNSKKHTRTHEEYLDLLAMVIERVNK